MAIAIGLVLAACSGPKRLNRPESGWQWVGEGKPGVFATAVSQCRHDVSRKHALGQYAASVQNSGKDLPNLYRKRPAYLQCMKNRGWVIGR